MKTLLVSSLIMMASFLFINPTFADICTDVEQNSYLKLNEAECYVLKQVERGEVAHFKETEWDIKYQERFTKIENRTLKVSFLKKLVTGSLSELKVSEKGKVALGRTKLTSCILGKRTPEIAIILS